MNTMRKIKKVMKSRPTLEGAGVHLRRAIGFDETSLTDPFLLLDDFRSNNPEFYLPGFPWHPHRGMETITYMLDGSVEHGDSLGNKGVIQPGDVQWMTAGSGIVHQEMPKGDLKGAMGGFQLWANLPAKDKMRAPQYRDVKQAQIPKVSLGNGVVVRVVAGTVAGKEGPVRDVVTHPTFLDVTILPNTTFTQPILRGQTAFAYVFEGAAYFDPNRDSYSFDMKGKNYFDFKRDCLLGSENLIVYDDGDEVAITTLEKPVRFLLGAAHPLREPVAWYGPIVMNTQEELRVAFDEFSKGTFLKLKKK
jgi:redox-sensitive bicupin YhaK (pirin superfamily)